MSFSCKSYNLELFFVIAIGLSCISIGFADDINLLAFFLYHFALFLFLLYSFLLGLHKTAVNLLSCAVVVYGLTSSLVVISLGRDAVTTATSLVSIFSILLIIPLLKSSLTYKQLVMVCIGLSFAWCLKIIFIVKSDLHLVLSGYRLSALNNEAVMPFYFAGFCMSLFFLKGSSYIVRASLVAFFLIFALFVGYKIVLALCLAAILSLLASKKNFLFATAVLMLGSIYVLYIDSSVLDYLASRFETIGGEGDSIRIHEIKESLKLFIESPILGYGYGYTVDDYYSYGDKKSYIHNYFVYTLTAVGVVGILLHFALWFSVAKKSKGLFSYDAFALYMLLITSLTSAIYKYPQFFFLLAIVSAVIVKKGQESAKD